LPAASISRLTSSECQGERREQPPLVATQQPQQVAHGYGTVKKVRK
jgi:hypothetical protein